MQHDFAAAPYWSATTARRCGTNYDCSGETARTPVRARGGGGGPGGTSPILRNDGPIACK